MDPRGLDRVEGAGITLTVDGDDLVARPTSAITAEIIALLKENKVSLIEAIQTRRRKLERASALGLVAKWSREFGYISIHDPTTGEWHDLQTEDAPDWTVSEARKRKDFWRAGDGRAYERSAAEMERLWQKEHPPEPGLIVEEHPLLK